ncbi:hypothetical protein F5Y13DRAFT_191174 [Hypoxylon sp. FL1857]|nr:hypothetical protein F5Y13DRAFT_191174 [Hypoxylon sp. FL1857]
MPATRSKATANGSSVTGNSKQILDNRTLNYDHSQNKEYWKTVLIICTFGLIIVVIIASVLGTQLSKSGKDFSPAPSSTPIPPTSGQKEPPFLSPPSSLSSSASSLPPSTSSTSSSTPSRTPSTSTPRSPTFTQGPSSTSSLLSLVSLPPLTQPPTATQDAKLTGLLPGEPCANDVDCFPNVCYRNTDQSTKTCCGTNIWGCPGATCTDYNDCLDPYGCKTESKICCGSPPYTILSGPTCYSAT